MCLDAGSGRLPSSHPNPRKTKNVGLLSGVPSRRTARHHCRTTPWPCRHSCRRATGQRWRNRAGQGPVLDTRVPSSPPSSTRRVPGMAATGASSTRRSVIVERPIPTMQFDAEGRTGRDLKRNGLKPAAWQHQRGSEAARKPSCAKKRPTQVIGARSRRRTDGGEDACRKIERSACAGYGSDAGLTRRWAATVGTGSPRPAVGPAYSAAQRTVGATSKAVNAHYRLFRVSRATGRRHVRHPARRCRRALFARLIVPLRRIFADDDYRDQDDDDQH